MANRVMVLVGTKKGGFTYTSDERRQQWQRSDPILPGWQVYHMAADTRGPEPRLYAAANHFAWGRSVAKSTDLGKTWDWRSKGLGFPEDMGVAVGNVWHVAPGHRSEPGVIYAGVQPAGLFRSEDGGESWASVDGINRHPDRPKWSGTGGGDSCLHSIEVDPRDRSHVYVAISAGGSFETRDGGKTWTLFSQTARVATPEAKEWIEDLMKQFPEFASDDIDPLAINEMHRMRMDAKDPNRMWAQTHVGVFRSDDGGGHWEDVTRGLPSFHGFPIAVTRRSPDAAYVVPLEIKGDNFRVCPGQFTVYRTIDAGRTWQALTNGLPGPDDYQSVYREGMDTDGLDREGVYVGTSNGQVYASTDGGERWERLPGTLPPILSVSCAVL